MPLLTNNSARKRQGAKELAMKMKLENSFAKDIRAYLKQIGQDFRAIFAITGNRINTARYNDELQAILKRHYRKTAKAFKNMLREEKDLQIPLESKDAIADEVDAVIAEYIDDHSIEQAVLINQTTQKEIDSSVASALSETVQNNEVIDNVVIADTARESFDSKIDGRATDISMTETQNIAETTKQTEATILSENAAVIGGITLGLAIMKKRWNAMLDKKTRVAHIMAEGQTVRITEAFRVDGEYLKYPGDTSMGASARNVCNCRCFVTYNV